MFPLFQDRDCRLSDTTPTKKSSTDYLSRLAAIANQKQIPDEAAQKYLEESGIIGPMGNGVSSVIRRSPKSSSSDSDTVKVIVSTKSYVCKPRDTCR